MQAEGELAYLYDVIKWCLDSYTIEVYRKSTNIPDTEKQYIIYNVDNNKVVYRKVIENGNEITVKGFNDWGELQVQVIGDGLEPPEVILDKILGRLYLHDEIKFQELERMHYMFSDVLVRGLTEVELNGIFKPTAYAYIRFRRVEVKNFSQAVSNFYIETSEETKVEVI